MRFLWGNFLKEVPPRPLKNLKRFFIELVLVGCFCLVSKLGNSVFSHGQTE